MTQLNTSITVLYRETGARFPDTMYNNIELIRMYIVYIFVPDRKI